jgi:hypothetical protein
MRKELKELLQNELITYLTVSEINAISEKVYGLVGRFEFVDDKAQWRTTFPKYYKMVTKLKTELKENKKVIREIQEIFPVLDVNKTLDNIERNALLNKKAFERLRIEDVELEKLFTDFIYKGEYIVLNIDKLLRNVSVTLKDICWCRDTSVCNNVCDDCENIKTFELLLKKQYESRYNKNTPKV